MVSILLVDDDHAFLQATSDVLKMLGHTVHAADSVAKAGKLIETERFSHALLDLFLPDGSGFQVIDDLVSQNQRAKIALVTGHPSVKSIGMKLHGPNITYFLKPIDLERLKSFVGSKPTAAEDGVGIKRHYGGLVGESAAMQSVYEMVDRVADTNANVLLMGESGVGKEVVAAAIHEAANPDKPFVAANCGAFARDLIGSELFGHEKGAFTGASNRKPGLFELAKDGTLFLDEITEMPLDLQPNLLRALEMKKVTRLGATETTDINCRVISATNRTEVDIVQENCLREDLYFRLAVFPIEIPPLRARKDDIELLANHFVDEFNRLNDTNVGIDKDSLARLSEYDWPGNVRELRHVLHRAYIMADLKSNTIRLPDRLSSPFSRTIQGSAVSKGVDVGKTVSQVERELIEKTLEHLNDNKSKAAETLGISLKTLYNKLNSYQES